MNLLTIVIPCFNEKESLPFLIKKLNQVSEKINFIIVDNGSTDGSKKYLESIKITKKNISLYFIEKNKGYGAGIFKALNLIEDSKYIGWIHGDLQFDFDKLENTVEFFEKANNKDLIFYKGVRIGRNKIDRFFSYFMGIFGSLVMNYNFYEINAQPTIFNKDLIKNAKNVPNDFRFDTYIYWLALKNNYTISREKFEFPQRKFGNSNWDYGIGSKLKFSYILFKYFFKLRKTI